MKISIITIVYNDAQNIRMTLESVLSQSYDDIQYVCIDGGSTDGTVDIINEYSDKISYFVSEPDKGIADAFNKGINVADGDYILILNSGDTYFDNSSVSDLVDFIIKSNKSYDIYSCNSVLMGYNGAVRVFKSEPEKLKYRMSVSHNGLAISRFVYENLSGYKIKYKIAMDYDFILRYINVFGLNKLISVPMSLTTYMLGGVSDSRSSLGFYESYRSKVLNGEGKFQSFIYFILLCCNHKISSMIQKLANK